MNLCDILLQKSLADLLVLADNYNISYPEYLDIPDWLDIVMFTHRDHDRVEYYLELSYEEDPFMPVKPEDFDTEETYQIVLKYRKKEKHLMDCLRMAQERKAELAEAIAAVLLQEDTLKGLLKAARDPVLRWLDPIASNYSGQEFPDEICPVDVPWKENWAVYCWEKWGYIIVESTMPWKSEDDHRHITGVKISSDLIDLYKHIHTEDFELDRQRNCMIQDCCRLADNYYEVTPIEILLEIYQRICPADSPLMIRNETELIDYVEAATDGDNVVFLFEQKNYVVSDTMMDEYSQLGNEEDTVFGMYMTLLKEGDITYYIPDAEEIQEYCEYGYWPSRESYKRLKEWLTGFYLDERYIENIGPGMFASFLDLSEEESEFYHESYSMDDVDEHVEEKMCLLTGLFMMDQDLDFILSDEEELTIPITEEAKAELVEIMEECLVNANKPSNFGHRGRF